MKLWFDDVRVAPLGWTWAKSFDDAVVLLRTGNVGNASLDHDMGGWADGGLAFDPNAPDGTDLVDWMVENATYPNGWVQVHSSNPAGADRMVNTLLRYGPFKPSVDPRLLLPD